MFIHEYQGRKVCAAHYLSEYMPALACALVEQIGVADHFEILLHDLLKMAGGPVERTFPTTLGTMGRSMRVTRLLASPVQVDAVVLTLESREKRHMYEKTKRVVLRRGTLPETAFVAPAVTAAVAPRAAQALAGGFGTDRLVTHAPRPSASYDDGARLVGDGASNAALERRVAALEALLMEGGAPATAAPRPDLEKRLHEQHLRIDQLLGDLRALEAHVGFKQSWDRDDGDDA